MSEINICIDILENRISKPGKKTVYFVITSPNASVILDSRVGAGIKFYNPEFKTNAICSKAEEIDYSNLKTAVCTSVYPEQPLVSGLYVVEVFNDENKIGMTTFSLR